MQSKNKFLQILIDGFSRLGDNFWFMLSYPDNKLCKAIIDVFTRLWTIVDIGDHLVEEVCRLSVNVLSKYLHNPKKTKDLNSAAWYILVSNLSETLLSQPACAVPSLMLLLRLLPVSAADPYLGLWRVYLKNGASGAALLESILAYTHSRKDLIFQRL